MTYSFNARALMHKRFNPQLSHLGTIEFHINNLVPGARDSLLLGISGFTLPDPRRVNPIDVHFLNGTVRYPGRPEPAGNFTVTFNDYIDGKQRLFLHQWFDKVYNERSGIGGLPSDIKSDAHVILFGQNGGQTAEYYMGGVWPQNDPQLPDINYNDTGTIAQMTIDFSIDYIIEEKLGGENFGGTTGTLLNSVQDSLAVAGGVVSGLETGLQGFSNIVNALS